MEKQRWEDVGRVREHFKVTMWKTHHDLLEVAMSKKCSRRCGRRHIVKTRKTLHVGSTFGRSTAPHKTTTTTLHYIPLHPAVVGEVTTATTPKSTTPTYSNHLSVHQQIRSPTHASQKFTLPMGSYLRNFRHRLVYIYICMYVCVCVRVCEHLDTAYMNELRYAYLCCKTQRYLWHFWIVWNLGKQWKTHEQHIDLGTSERTVQVATEESDAQYCTQVCLRKFNQNWVSFIQNFLHMSTYFDLKIFEERPSPMKTRVAAMYKFGPTSPFPAIPHLCWWLDSKRKPGDAQRFWEDTLRPKVAPTSAWQIEFLGGRGAVLSWLCTYFARRRHQLVDPQWSSNVFFHQHEGSQLSHAIPEVWFFRSSKCFDHDPFEFLILAMHFFLAISQWLDGRAPRPERSVLPARELIFAALSDSGQIQQITEDQDQQNHMGLPPLEKCGSGKKHPEISRNHCLQELKEYWNLWHTWTVLYNTSDPTEAWNALPTHLFQPILDLV